MSGTQIPPTDHVGKHCQPKEMIQEELPDGSLATTGVRGTAFLPDEDGVSVAWVEHTHHSTIANPIRAMIGCMSLRTVRKSHRLALFKVQDIQACGKKFGKSIGVVHDPQPNYDCHALVVGIDPSLSDLLDLIAAECISMEAMLT